MEQVKQITLEKALRLLKSVGCQYAVIDPDGNKHGDLAVAEEKKKPKTRTGTWKHGEVAALIRSKISDMGIGDVVCIEYNDENIGAVQSTTGPMMQGMYGKGNYTTSLNRGQGHLEVLRVA